MKKLAIILLGLFPLVLSSCLKEEEDYFDKSASARIEEAVKNAISVLEGAENGWAVKYYPNPTQTFGGFNLFFKFDDGTVTVSSEIESASTTATSLYSVGQEAGPTLAIDTKNELINYFAHPRNPDGYGSNYKGLEGDYLWTVLSATPEKVMLRGVKSGSLYTLTPLETSDWPSEMQAYKNAASDMEFPSYVCVVKGDSLECITTSEGKFLYRNLTIRQETDKGIESYAAPFIYTKTGIELYEPLTINGVTAQKLDLKEEYYFANEDDSFIISGPKPVTSDNILTYGAVETTFNTVKVTVTHPIPTLTTWRRSCLRRSQVIPTSNCGTRSATCLRPATSTRVRKHSRSTTCTTRRNISSSVSVSTQRPWPQRPRYSARA